MNTDITWKIGGEAGFGIMSSGTIFSKTFSRQGFFIFATNEYPSLIRGGHNIITVRVASTPFHALRKKPDILVALNRETVKLHKDEVQKGTAIIFDPKDGEWKPADFPVEPLLLPIPFSDIVKKFGGDAVMRNTVAIGASVAFCGCDFTWLSDVLTDLFQKKSSEVVAHNNTIARAGFDFVRNNFPAVSKLRLKLPENNQSFITMNSNEAVGIGALESGMRFAAIYPMTPINSLITFLADRADETGVLYVQPEDEIAGMNMAVGASIAGARSMVATSGGGFALMVEALSLAGIIETPLVIDLGMRPGPATGMPTWTEQGELQFAIHAGHGEFARIILAPSNAEEAYTLTKQAFELADHFHIPVFILTDKYINESLWCVRKDVFESAHAIVRDTIVSNIHQSPQFRRYFMNGRDGISLRSLPGERNGQFIANSYEHDEEGFTTEDASIRSKMVEKRLAKIDAIRKYSPLPTVYGDKIADITFVCFGSTAGPVHEAIDILADKNIRAKCLHFQWVYPLPGTLARMLSEEKRLICVEGNATGQLASLIRETTGIEIQEKLLTYSGRQIFAEEIVEFVSA